MAVFAADPTAAACYRVPAICAAASAGCGLGTDTATLTDPERRAWREQPSRIAQR
jgi:hypothetical protein